MTTNKLSARHRARVLALQGLYQWYFSGAPLEKIENQFVTFNNMEKVDGELFRELLFNIPQKVETIDATIAPHLDRDLNELSPIELQILRIGTYELMFSEDMPYKVVINESIELAKDFGAESSHKYINGILDKVVRVLKPDEFGG